MDLKIFFRLIFAPNIGKEIFGDLVFLGTMHFGVVRKRVSALFSESMVHECTLNTSEEYQRGASG